jgi:formylglycine-generating enzyme required for sulfatase activity/tRNA A-37 threonylcarbamoyl transferase component Bud32
MPRSLSDVSATLSVHGVGLAGAPLAQVLCADMERRWAAGHPVRVEEYLEHFPSLSADPQAVIDLIYAEFLRREQFGPPPTAEEYLARFPALADGLRRQLDVHALLCGESILDPAANSAAPPATWPNGPQVPATLQRPGVSTDSWPETCGLQGGAGKSTPRAAPVNVPGYEILRELGRGGMGVVYQARHVRLNRIVALKMVLAGSHAAPDEQARFLAEAEAVAHLQHPHIVQIYETGQHGGLPYMALEFVESGSLALRIKDAPLAPTEAAHVVEQVARGMDYAHSRGIVHRDLKPENVLLAADGTPKITDFGLAKRVEGGGDLTQTGAIMGTPSYMAPEQARGSSKAVGPAADVYALGAILYRLLTGRPPFQAASAHETVLQVITEEPLRLRQLNARLPRDLETICLKCLRKEAGKRYLTALALAEDLRRFQAGEPIAARPVGRWERAAKWVRRKPAVAALTAAVLLVSLLGLAGIVWKYLEAEQQKDIAVAKEQQALLEADKARKARDFLVSIFRISEKDIQAGNITAREILLQAAKRIPLEFAEQPELRAELLAAIEEVNRTLDRSIPAAMVLEVRGPVQFLSANGEPKPLAPQVLLFPGDRLTLPADADVKLVVLSDLHQEQLEPAREATIGRKGCQPANVVRRRDNNVMMTFVRLPKGTFYMGWDGPKKGVKTEIKEDFEIAVHFVTQGQWQAVMGNNPSWFSRNNGGSGFVKNISDEELALFPVESVSWIDAQEFIDRLNKQTSGAGWLYRLPTEAEWEYACRGGATSEEECAFHFYFDQPTNDLSSEQANFDGNRPFGQAAKGKFLQRPTRVGAYPPNKLGLCDMHGNLWQWCADLHTPGGPDRMCRGGSWVLNGSYCRAAYRIKSLQTYRNYTYGFRLVRVPAR